MIHAWLWIQDTSPLSVWYFECSHTFVAEIKSLCRNWSSPNVAKWGNGIAMFTKFNELEEVHHPIQQREELSFITQFNK